MTEAGIHCELDGERSTYLRRHSQISAPSGFKSEIASAISAYSASPIQNPFSLSFKFGAGRQIPNFLWRKSRSLLNSRSAARAASSPKIKRDGAIDSGSRGDRPDIKVHLCRTAREGQSQDGDGLPQSPSQSRSLQKPHHPHRQRNPVTDLPKNCVGPNTRWRVHMFDMLRDVNGIEHRLLKPNHPWTSDQVERVNRTLKNATAKPYPLRNARSAQGSRPSLPHGQQLCQTAQDLPRSQAL